MKTKNRVFLSVALLISAFTVMAQAPAGYYDSLEGKSGSELKNAVKQIGKKGFKAITYGDDTWDAFRSTDIRIIDGKECWWDMYSANNVAVSSGNPGMNIEHSVANSWWGGTKNNAYKDIVHLNPSNSEANSRKGNYPIGEINGTPKWTNGITSVGSPKSGQGGGCTSVYEPHAMYKGDFARVFMYMFTIYDDISWENATGTGDGRGRMYVYTGGTAQLQPWAYTLMLAWNVSDPVSEKEINRNNGIQKEQGNRNPFIDLPDLGDYIWGSKAGQAYHVEGAHIPDPGKDPGEDPNPGEGDDPELPPLNPNLEGKYILVENESDLSADEKYIIISSDTHLALSTATGNKCLTPTSEAAISDKIIEEAPEQTALITLEPSGENYRLHLWDINGNNFGYLVSQKAKDLGITETASDQGTDASISLSDGKATISYGSAGYLKYNASAKMWRTYTSGQEDLSLYRFIPTSGTTSITDSTEEIFQILISGNCITAPSGSLIFDLNGRAVNPDNLDKGVYIVVSPERKKRVKAIIGL